MQHFNPQNLIHRGTVLAEAFLLSSKILGETEMRRRVLCCWQKGVRIYRRSEDLILLLKEAKQVDTRRSLGLPFVRYGKVLSAVPIKQKDLAQLADSEEILIFLNEGTLETVRLHDLKTERIESWFDMADLQIVETISLGETLTQPPRLINVISEDDVNLRAELKDVPRADSQLVEILTKLKALKEAKEDKKYGSSFSSFNSSEGVGNSFTNIFSSIFGNLKDLFASLQTTSRVTSTANYTKTGWTNNPNAESGEPDAISKIYNRFRHFAVKALVQMRMAQIFGRRQAKYLAEMMEKFERGDIEEALKYAIPLEDMQALRDIMEKPTALFLPRPRENLQITFGQNTGGSAINLETEWFEHLRKLYRQSFERLVAQGKIEDAAFVLAELLKSNAEAVEFLSKHGKFRLAAELAEVRKLPKETIVRQWFLAGEKVRAVQLAILYNCFEYAVTKLEQDGNFQTGGAQLREIWAETLAQSGNFPAAVDVIWKLEEKRPRAKDWIDKAIDFGGDVAARMLARKIMLYPDSFDEVKEKFQKIVGGDEPYAVKMRASFARSVFKQSINNELRTLLRPLTRKILNDALTSSQSLSSKEFRELVVIARNNTLRTDLPAFPQNQSIPTNVFFELTIPANDKGASFIHDACILPDGKIVVALGEAGVKIVSSYGKTTAYFDQPAEKLVVSDFSNKAIALIKRNDISRLSRIDFIERRAKFWCDTKVDVYAQSFDGNTWFMGLEDEFYAIDANAKSFEALWRVPDVGGKVYSVSRSNSQVKFLTLSSKGFETWWYELPNLTLRSRKDRQWLDKLGEAFWNKANISEGGHSVVIVEERIEHSEQSRFYAIIFDHEHILLKFDFPQSLKGFNQPEILKQYSVLVGYAKEQYAKVYVFFGGNLTAAFTLESAQHISTKFIGGVLSIADDCGRVLIYDYENRILRQNIRV